MKDIYKRSLEKTKKCAGADEKTPSRAQYFSWINNTNEGATEEHTLVNLEYFKWLRDEYGMQLDIYAWDAGNLDGSAGTYKNFDSPKIKAQYPNGYGKCAEAAREIGAKLGVWCGPDGFGDTPESVKARRELMVSLCRDYNFGLFKMDAVCGTLRPEMQEEFSSMMKECREYSPDLILLNHRLDLGIGEPYSTTFLWNGMETYIDVHVNNHRCAPHHREYMFHRGNVPHMLRLCEDHGVCLSSCMDFFEDDLIYQAFGRSLILAPEIYGNPWLLRDDEQAKLARIYNLHRTYRDILVGGVELPEYYGSSAVSRGDGDVRFITSGNPSWEKKKIRICPSKDLGLEDTQRKFAVSIHHPYEKFVGFCSGEESVEIEIEPFRAVLVEVAVVEKAYPMLTSCAYEVLHENDGTPDKVKIIAAYGKIEKLLGGVRCPVSGELQSIEPFDNTLKAPVILDADFERGDIPANAEQIFETAQFIIDNDSLEKRSLDRAGETKIPQVQAARDAFFSQERYALRGCESRFAFDGKDNTYFGKSYTNYGADIRMGNGCLRVDFGDIFDADEVVIEYLDAEREDMDEFTPQVISETAHSSADLDTWTLSPLSESQSLGREEFPYVVNSVHNIVGIEMSRRRVRYSVDAPIRYFRIPHTYDMVTKIALVKDGCEIKTPSARANNQQMSYSDRTVEGYRCAHVQIPDLKASGEFYLSVGINGEHGREGVYVVAELDGKLYGCADRAPSYMSNVWECGVRKVNSNYTYYLDVAPEMLGRELKLHVIEMTEVCAGAEIDIHLCQRNYDLDGVVCEI